MANLMSGRGLLKTAENLWGWIMVTLITILGGAPLVIGLAVPAHADPSQDQRFQTLLANVGLDPVALPLYRQEATEACHRIANGEHTQDVVDDLHRETRYSWGAEESIVSAGITVYCPQVPDVS